MVKPLRVAVLGAGPIGLEAALYAKLAGLGVTVFETGQVAEHVSRWGHVRLFTPFGQNVTSLGKQTLKHEQPKREFPPDDALQTGREFRETYLVPLAESDALKPHIVQAGVLAVGRAGWRKGEPEPTKLPPFRLLVRDPKGQERFEVADAVFDCTGTYGRPNWAGDGGIPALGEIAARPHASYWLDDILGAKKAAYAGKSVAVIGGGYSAASTVCQLATLADENQSTWIVWLTHGPKSQPLARIPADPLRERDRLAMRANSLACRCDGNLEYHAPAIIDEIVSAGPDKGFRIAARVAGKPMTWEVERLIANVGYRPDLALCQELRVAEPANELLSGEPGYFMLGAKSRGRDSNFFLRDGHDQIRKVVAHLVGDKKLDLYARKAA